MPARITLPRPVHLSKLFVGHVLKASVEARVGKGDAIAEIATANRSISVYLAVGLNKYTPPTVWISSEALGPVVLGKEYLLYADTIKDQYKDSQAKYAVWTNLAHKLDLGVDAENKVAFCMIAFEGGSLGDIKTICNKAFVREALYHLEYWNMNQAAADLVSYRTEDQKRQDR